MTALARVPLVVGNRHGKRDLDEFLKADTTTSTNGGSVTEHQLRNLSLQLMAATAEIDQKRGRIAAVEHQVHEAQQEADALRLFMVEQTMIQQQREKQLRDEREAIASEADLLRLSLAERDMALASKERQLRAKQELIDAQQEIPNELDALRLSLAEAEMCTARLREKLRAEEARVGVERSLRLETEALLRAQRSVSHPTMLGLLVLIAQLADHHCDPEDSSAISEYAAWRSLVAAADVDPFDERLWDGATRILALREYQ